MFRLSRTKKIVLFLGLALIIVCVPARAHADWLDSLASFGNFSATDGIAGGLLKLFLAVLTMVQGLLLDGIVKMGQALTWIIGLRPDGGGAVVYGAWSILKDFCNMAFIVVLILTSFGTIFNTFQFAFLKPYTIYNKTLVGGFLAAAIFMNFSLAIGQSIVALSNKVTDVMVGIIVPIGTRQGIGDQIAAELNVAQAVARKKVPLASLGGTTSTGAPAATPAPDQSATTPTAEQKQRANLGWQNQFEGNYLKCLDAAHFWTRNSSCYQAAVKQVTPIPYPDVATANQRRYSTGAGDPPSVTKVGGILYTGIGGDSQYVIKSDYDSSVISAAQAVADMSSPAAIAKQIPSVIYSVFLLLVLLLSFLCVIIFMLIRIPAVWVILVLSPLAWVGLMFPGETAWKKWWSQFMAWNLFSPMYLFMIYFGLYMLAQQPNLLAQLGSNGSAIDAQFGALLFYIMTGIIFVGGSAAVVSIAFKGGTVAGNVFGQISGALGIKGDYGAVGAVYRGTGLQTELESRYKGLAAGLQSQRERIPFLSQQRQKQRSEDLERRFKTTFGTKDVAQADLRKRVSETMKKNAEEGLSVKDMQEKFKNKNTGNVEKIALGRALLKEGALNAPQMKELADMSDEKTLGTIGQNQVRQEVARKLSEQAKEKSFKNSADAQSAYMALSTPEEQEKFLKDLKKNQIVEYALLADQKISLKEDAGLKPSEVLESRSASLGADDVPKILELAQEGKISMGPSSNVQYRVNDLLAKPENIQKARDSAARSPVAKQALTDLVQKINEDKKIKERTLALQSEQQEAIKEDRARSAAARNPQPSSGATGGTPPTTPPPVAPAPQRPVAPAPQRPVAPRQPTPPSSPGLGSPRINLSQGRVDRTIRTAQNINRPPSAPGTPRPGTPPTPPARPPGNTPKT